MNSLQSRISGEVVTIEEELRRLRKEIQFVEGVLGRASRGLEALPRGAPNDPHAERRRRAAALATMALHEARRAVSDAERSREQGLRSTGRWLAEFESHGGGSGGAAPAGREGPASTDAPPSAVAGDLELPPPGGFWQTLPETIGRLGARDLANEAGADGMAGVVVEALLSPIPLAAPAFVAVSVAGQQVAAEILKLRTDDASAADQLRAVLDRHLDIVLSGSAEQRRVLYAKLALAAALSAVTLLLPVIPPLAMASTSMAAAGAFWVLEQHADARAHRPTPHSPEGHP